MSPRVWKANFLSEFLIIDQKVIGQALLKRSVEPCVTY